MSTVRVRPDGTVRVPRQRSYRFRFVQVLLALALFLYGIHKFAGVDVPHVPFVSCANGVMLPPPASEPSGADGVAYDAGQAVRYLSQQKPDPSAVKASVQDAASKAGSLVGQFTAAWKGAAPQVKAGAAAGTTETAAPVSQCGCPGQTLPAATGTDGVETAARAALRAGWTGEDAVVAVAIAGAESGYRHDAANGHSSARGMWQTMMSYHAAKYHGASWSDPYANGRVAHEIWANAHGWSPWTTYTSGAYRSHMAEARAALAAVSGGSSSTTVPAVYTKPVDSTSHLRPITIKAEAYIRSTLGFKGTIYGYSYRNIAGTNVLSEHAKGLALDMMTKDLSVGQPIADYFSGRGAAAWHVHNVIWQDRIWTSEGQRWKPYGDHGSPTQNHMDHVHVDFHDVPVAGLAPAPAATAAAAKCSSGVQGAIATSGGGIVTAGGRTVLSPGMAQRTGGRDFALATFNLHGASHTGDVSALKRLPRAIQVLAKHHVDVVGFQEMQGIQARAFDRLAGGTFARFAPKTAHGKTDYDNSLAWRQSAFRFISGRYLSVPYFNGHHRLMPVVRLENRATGQVMTFVNAHNAANTAQYHHQERWRDAALRMELRYLAGVKEPAFYTADTNDHHLGPKLAGSTMRGGSADTYGHIDWILGSPGHRPLSVTTDDSALVDATTDHPFVVARLRG